MEFDKIKQKKKTKKNDRLNSRHTVLICAASGQMFHQSLAEIFAHFPSRHLAGVIFPQEAIAAGSAGGGCIKRKGISTFITIVTHEIGSFYNFVKR